MKKSKVQVKLTNCLMCGVLLAPKEAIFCHTCLRFIRYKYGTLEHFAKRYSEEKHERKTLD